MPIHDFICNKCGTSKEKIVKFSEADKKFDCVNNDCGGEMSRSNTPPQGTRAILKGRFH